MENDNQISKRIELTKKDYAIGALILFIMCAVIFAALFCRVEYLAFEINEDVDAYLGKLPRYLLSGGIICICAGAIFSYMLIACREGIKQKKILALTATCIALNFIIAAAAEYFSVYALPLCIAAVLVAHLIDTKLGFITNLVTVALAAVLLLNLNITGQMAENILSILTVSVIALLMGSIAVFNLDKNTTNLQFISRLVLCSLLSYPLLAFFEALMYDGSAGYDFSGFWYKLAAVAAGMFFQVLFIMLLIPILEYIFNLVTRGRLAALCDFNQPLLKRLSEEAPATFYHSQSVGNLAESCANAIGENLYMARAAALYHDVGKLMNVNYFSENQGEVNPHDSITPELSCEILRSHTKDGYELAMAARVPKEIANVTIEHHGTMYMTFFYKKAQELTDGEIDINLYRYAGPLPSTKIAAIIMICDSCEAAIRALKSNDRDTLDKLVRGIIEDRIEYGQFDNCEITMKDLAVIRQTIVNFSTGMYHKRVEYPKKNEFMPGGPQ